MHSKQIWAVGLKQQPGILMVLMEDKVSEVLKLIFALD